MKPLRNKLYRTAQLAALAVLISLSGAQAQVSLLLGEYPESYTVADGDTLWNIASQFLQDPERWPEI
ncbi:MAG: LysM peptidoglycan-binding domain-containing protein [Gammaproteobacteria bacterium]|jgi:nucleoid-associated protein YgaU|nr:LysM peptidoglycan-binding domain-containing protein [Gammaproteobacteria bacterium]MDP6653261.1 LysM peptidoglycan-binding domain-containing protein [Gammaproteobacteria bacterium]|tara:strand:+ start:131 stop:331 length:201 start_codon:yes stop_codon:yes gene_type:complete